MPFWGRKQQQAQPLDEAAYNAPDASVDAGAAPATKAGLARLVGSAADDVDWSPLPAPTTSKHTGPLPYAVKEKKVETSLKDHSTAAVKLRATVVDAPYDVMFDLLADPHKHEDIFDAIESAHAELVEERGSVKKWRLDYRARWKFWKVGGVCDNRLWMTTDREKGTVSFVLREPGFLRRYEGTWTITNPEGLGPDAASPPPSASPSASSTHGSPFSISSARASLSGLWPPASPSSSSGSSSNCGGSSSTTPRMSSSSSAANLLASLHNPFTSLQRLSAGGHSAGPAPALPPPVVVPAPRVHAGGPTLVRVDKLMSPKVSPPFPINQVLKGHAAHQVKEMLDGLLFATAKAVKADGSETEAATARQA